MITRGPMWLGVAGTLCCALLLVPVSDAQMTHDEHAGPGRAATHSGDEMMEDAAMGHGEMPMPATVGWRNAEIPLSPLHPTAGRQMGRVDTIGVPPLGYELDGDVKVFTVIAQPIEQYLATGDPPDDSIIPELNRFVGAAHAHYVAKQVRVWGFNGTSPGPTIECHEGDRIRVILKNELPEPTSIHWHGLEVPNEQDGAAGHTQPAVMPGESFAYEFTLFQTGTFLYHSGFNMMKQDHMGLAGFVVVHPKDYAHTIDKDFAIMLQEWALLPGNPYPDLVTMDFNWFTFNGKSAPDIPVLTVNQGDRVRIRFGNMSMDSHPIHVHGYTWHVVGTEGGPIPEAAQWPGATINVPPGTTRDVEFVAWNPGLWRLHCHKLHHIINAHADIPMGIMGHGGMFTLVNVIPKDANAPWRHPRQKEARS